MFAANLSDVAESSIKPIPTLEVDGQRASPVSELKVGVRRELWIYLLAAVLVATTVEWLTYHRRITV